MSARDKLIRLLSQGSLSQNDIPKLTGLSKSRVSEVLRELEREGKVVRTKGPGNTREVSLRKLIRVGAIRAAEYPFVVPFLRSLKEKGFLVEFRFYDNGIDLTLDLVRGNTEVVFSPLVTQLILSAIFPEVKIVAGGAAGGGALIGNEGDRVGSTVLSSMEVWSHLVGRDNIVPATSASQLETMLRFGKVQAVALWEPFATKLKREGYRVQYFEPMECCSMAVRRGADADLLVRTYEESMTLFKSSTDRWIPIYAELLGEDGSLLSESIKNYIFDTYLDIDGFVRKLRSSGLYLPGSRV